VHRLDKKLVCGFK